MNRSSSRSTKMEGNEIGVTKVEFVRAAFKPAPTKGQRRGARSRCERMLSLAIPGEGARG